MSENNRKKKQLLIIILLFFMFISMSGALIGTYARYVSKLNDTTLNADVVAWNFENDNTTASLMVNLMNTYDTNSLVEGKIAPGTNGNFTVSLSNENNTYPIDYELQLIMDSHPENFKYSYQGQELIDNKIKGSIDANAKQDIVIDWEWSYHSNDLSDSIDTEEGSNPLDYTVSCMISASQHVD